VKTVGIFRELWPGDSPETQVSLAESVQHSALPDAQDVIGYLTSGHGLIDTMDATQDVLGSDEWTIGSSSILTDGEWLWRKDLAFYVGKYNVRLPDEFLRTIRANQYHVPDRDYETLRACSQEAKRVLFAK
jgi:hypothetical protein